MSVTYANPYTNNAQLSSLEQDVLWEYAKLGDKIKRMTNLARLTSESPNEPLLAGLRTLEKKMGLVLTLFKASVWAVIVDSQTAAEAEEARIMQVSGGDEVSFGQVALGDWEAEGDSLAEELY